MIEHPERQVGEFAAAGCASIEEKRCNEDDERQPDEACARQLFEQFRIRSDVTRSSRTSVDQSGADAFP
jgi:hypothetical protein